MTRGRVRPWMAILAGLSAGLAIWLTRDTDDGLIALREPERTPLGAQAELLTGQLFRGRRPIGRLVLLYVPAAQAQPRLILNPERRPLQRIAEDAPWLMNAGYFTPERRATGLLVSAGQTLSPFIPQAGAAGSGVLVLEGGQVRLLERDAVKDRSFAGAGLAIQAGPRIIEEGGLPGIRSDNGRHANRSFIGRDRSGRLALGVSYHPRRGTGLSLYELQRVLTQTLASLDPALRLDAALNLDGGPSTGLRCRLTSPAILLPEGSSVLSLLAIALQQARPPTSPQAEPAGAPAGGAPGPKPPP